MIATYEELLASLPEEIKTKEILEGSENDYGWHKRSLKETYDEEVATINRYASNAKEPDAHLCTFQNHGSQWVAEFWVNDLSIPRSNAVNWHLQNTSQWKYAGCILIDHNEVSTHH